MKTILAKCISLGLCIIMVLSMAAINVNASSWNVAEELGFEVPKTQYTSYCWISERVKETKYENQVAGIVYYQTCACKDKYNYKVSNSKFTQMTRVITEPKSVSITYPYVLWFKKTAILKFQTDYVEMYDGLVSGQKICNYLATSPAIDATTVVNSGWSSGIDKSFSYKGIELGISGESGTSYSSNEGVASALNSTKINEYFKVRFDFKNLWWDTATQEQENLAYNQCEFYTAVSYYGTPQVMNKYSHTGKYDVRFSGHYLQYLFPSDIFDHSVSVNVSDSLTFTYFTY